MPDETLDCFADRDPKLRRVYRARDAMEAEFVRGLLDEEGIAAVVQGTALQVGLGPVLGGSALPAVYVREEDLEPARDVVGRYERGEIERPRGDDWTCPHCGERIEGQFTACWKCGTPRDAVDEA